MWVTGGVGEILSPYANPCIEGHFRKHHGNKLLLRPSW